MIFLPGQLTQTAVQRVLPDIMQAVDRINRAALVLLDLSAAFDTVAQSVLLERLRTDTFDVDDIVQRSLRSYLSGRHQ